MSSAEMTFGRFVTKKSILPDVVVDCSEWADPSITEWTTGTFVAKKTTLPEVVTGLTVPHLRLKVSFQPGVSLEALEATTKAMVERLHAAAPDLNLQYDPTLSGLERDSRGAWVAALDLTPQTPSVDIDERCVELFEIARAAAYDRGAELVHSGV